MYILAFRTGPVDNVISAHIQLVFGIDARALARQWHVVHMLPWAASDSRVTYGQIKW